MTSKQKREYALLLYTKNDGYTMRDIADKCGVHPNTITRWRKDDDWDKIAETLLTTRHEQLRRLYMQLKELNDVIMGREGGKRYPTKAEADTMTQITRSIANLEKEISAGVIVDVFVKFLEYSAKIDGDL
ncbi:MAG: helix-turn-helix domain-containing protein, partial [Bacteroidota bacterium]